MTLLRFSQGFAVFAVCLACFRATAQPGNPDYGLYKIDHRVLALDGTEKVRGPRIVRVTNLNVLRYQYKLGTTVTYTNPPVATDVLSPAPTNQTNTKTTAQLFTAPNGGGANVREKKLQAGCTTDLTTQVNTVRAQLLTESTATNTLVESTNTVAQAVSDAGVSLHTLLQQSDADLSTSRTAYQNDISDTAALVATAVSAPWPATQAALAARAAAQAQIKQRTEDAIACIRLAGGHQDLLDALNDVTSDLNSLESELEAIQPGRDEYNHWVTNRTMLLSWNARLSTLNAALANAPFSDGDPLALSQPAGCDYFSASTKDTVVSLETLSDSLNDSEQGGGGQKLPAPEKLVTVECETPIVLAVGVAFSSLPEHEYAVQQTGSTTTTTNGVTTTTPVNTFQYTSNSKFHPEAVGAIHVRLYDWEQARLSFNGTFAVAANIKGQSAGGSSADYLIGATVGFSRYAFLTAGAYIGQVATLDGGFKVGDQVPSGVTTPPLQVGYQTGFGMALTFSK